MKRFTIYCTPEQTKKALELGAPIKIVCPYTKINTKFDESVIVLSHSNVDSTNRTTYTLTNTPTAEQMISWLEEQGIYFDTEWSWDKQLKVWVWDNPNRGHIYTSYNNSRKEATLASINAALEYLEKQKNEL